MSLRRYLRLLILSLVVLTIATGPTLATENTNMALSEADIIAKYFEVMLPSLDQFRLTADAYWNNQRVGYGTFGWDSGFHITGTMLSPAIHEQGPVSFAFRPSGVALLKTPEGEVVIADLATEAEAIETLIKVFNRDLYIGFFDLAATGMKVTGTTTFNGRPVYILEADPYKPSAEEMLEYMLNHPLFTEFVPEEERIELLETYNSEPVLQPEDVTPVPVYIDMQDFLVLGWDQAAFDKMWPAVNKVLADQEGVTLPQPHISIGDMYINDEGHIDFITYNFSMDIPRSLLEDAVKNATTDTQVASDLGKMGIMADFSIEMARTDGIYLPSDIAISVTVDLTGMEATGYNAALALNPVQTHTVELSLEWDLQRGADTALLNNSKLITAETSLLHALELLEDGYYDAAIAPIERLLGVAPSFVEGYVMLSDAYLFSGRFEQAIALLEMLCEIMPGNMWLTNNLAWAYVDTELNVERGLELILQLNEDLGGTMPAAATDTLAWALYKNGKYAEAEVAIKRTIELAIIEQEEDMGTVYYHYAEILFAAGKYAEAKTAITEALEYEDTTPEMYALEKRIDAQLVPVTP